MTGGTGKFRGAKGTITAKNLNAKGTRTEVIVRYHWPREAALDEHLSK